MRTIGIRSPTDRFAADRRKWTASSWSCHASLRGKGGSNRNEVAPAARDVLQGAYRWMAIGLQGLQQRIAGSSSAVGRRERAAASRAANRSIWARLEGDPPLLTLRRIRLRTRPAGWREDARLSRRAPTQSRRFAAGVRTRPRAPGRSREADDARDAAPAPYEPPPARPRFQASRPAPSIPTAIAKTSDRTAIWPGMASKTPYARSPRNKAR